MRKYKNTLDKGSVRYIVFRENNTWYGVALEFNLTVEADDKNLALVDLFDAIQGYVEAARLNKMRPVVLNQTVEPEYAKLWSVLKENNYGARPRHDTALTIRPQQVFTFGTVPQYA